VANHGNENRLRSHTFNIQLIKLRGAVGLDLKPVKLGKTIELKYIPFAELAIPWNVCVEAVNPGREGGAPKESSTRPRGKMTANGSKVPKTIRPSDLDALKYSIGQYGLLKPFEVAELPERLDFFYGNGKYVIIDGHRRYFAIREMLRLPTEHDEMKQKDTLRTNSKHDQVIKGEVQAQEQFDRLDIRNYVLIPCLVYPYATFLQVVRHIIEDKRFSVKPSKDDFELVERMRAAGMQDLSPEDLSDLWETRSRINEERQAIENTLHEIRNRMKEKEQSEKVEQAKVGETC